MISIKFLLPTESVSTHTHPRTPTAFLLILEAGQNPGQIPQPVESGCQGSNPIYIPSWLCDLGQIT